MLQFRTFTGPFHRFFRELFIYPPPTVSLFLLSTSLLFSASQDGTWVQQSRVGGLSEFGRVVVKEMNRMGMIVDISHVHYDTMHKTLDCSLAPVIFSHSSSKCVASSSRSFPPPSCYPWAHRLLSQPWGEASSKHVNDSCPRAHSPPASPFLCSPLFPTIHPKPPSSALRRALCDHPRDVPDDILLRLKENGGVVMINFCTNFVAGPFWVRGGKVGATILEVADHIDHIKAVAGVDHIGIGTPPASHAFPSPQAENR